MQLQAPSEASGSSSRLRGSGLIELNHMTAIEEKLDAVMNRSAEGPIEEGPYQV